MKSTKIMKASRKRFILDRVASSGFTTFYFDEAHRITKKEIQAIAKTGELDIVTSKSEYIVVQKGRE